MKKLLFWLLLALNFTFPLMVVSNRVDNDFGFHLRFGQDLHTQTTFPYLDTYTYTKYGQPWVNHEWGGDWLIYEIYNRLGYWWINIIAILFSTLGFLIIGKAFNKKITPTFLFFMLLCQWSVSHIFSPRLAMWTQFFAALVFYLIENWSKKRWAIYLIAPILWIWSLMHGSWSVGFIIMNMYLGVMLLGLILPKKYAHYLNEKPVSKNFIYDLIAVQILSLILIAINPYGLGIYREIAVYFSQSYYKSYITEWMPSYTYPMFFSILIMQTIALVLMCYGFLKRRLSFTHLLLFIAFFYSSIFYKRQAIFMALMIPMIFENTWEIVWPELNKIFKKYFSLKTFNICLIIIVGFGVYYTTTNVHYTKDFWNDEQLFVANSQPFAAAKFLNQTLKQPSKVFNEFSWGAYLNWAVPNALVFLDGRGTVSWMYNSTTTMLQEYVDMKNNDGALKRVENTGAQYILLRQPKFVIASAPKKIDFIFFGSDFQKKLGIDKTPLEIELDKSANWKKIFSDTKANIWQKITP